MRKQFLVWLAVPALLIGCGQSEEETKEEEVASTPESVARSYSEAINKMDYEAAKEYADDATDEILEMMKGFSDMATEEDKKKAQNSKVTEVKCDEVVEDKTNCTCTVEVGEETRTETYVVKKEGDDWLVHMEKDAGMDETDMDMDMDVDVDLDELQDSLDAEMESLKEELENF